MVTQLLFWTHQKVFFGSERKRNMDEKGDLKVEKDKEEGKIVAEIIDSTGSQTGMQKVSTNEPLPCRFTFIYFRMRSKKKVNHPRL